MVQADLIDYYRVGRFDLIQLILRAISIPVENIGASSYRKRGSVLVSIHNSQLFIRSHVEPCVEDDQLLT